MVPASALTPTYPNRHSARVMTRSGWPEGRLIGMKQNRRNRQNAGKRKRSDSGENGPIWLWGTHAVTAAINNPERHILSLIATENAARRADISDYQPQTGKEIADRLPPGAVHQGLAARAEPLPGWTLDELISAAPARIAILDQIADPRNMGAIFRSAAAFGIEALILQTRHSPPITGIVAKTAAGAVEMVKEVRVVNIARTLEALADAGWLTIGLSGATDLPLSQAISGETRLALTLGAEGVGLRRGVEKACQCVARIPMHDQMESLNVSAAAAIAFYEAARGHISA